MRTIGYGAAVLAASSLLWAQQASSHRTGPQKDTSVIDARGTAHVTRVIPVPASLSPQAKEWVGAAVSDKQTHLTIAEQRRDTDKWQTQEGAKAKTLYPVHLANGTIAGVPVRIVTPLEIPKTNRDRVMLNVHGGGFVVDSGSLIETIPIANLTKTKVVAVLYRLSPEHPFPAAVEDTVAVYKELLTKYPAKHIGLYGTSAGAILTAEVAVKLKQLGLPLPGALGVFSGLGDFSRPGDSQAMYALDGLSGYLGAVPFFGDHTTAVMYALQGISGYLPPPSSVSPASPHANDHYGDKNLRNPVLSPLFADVHGFPPTLFISSTRDMLLSGTTMLQRHFYESGVKSPMVIFEGLPHAFWVNVDLPESREAFGIMAKFLDTHVEK